jgi:hypothetical protein
MGTECTANCHTFRLHLIARGIDVGARPVAESERDFAVPGVRGPLKISGRWNRQPGFTRDVAELPARRPHV